MDWGGGGLGGVTPTSANAPDPEQMVRQGLSAEPELITCAMSHCLRRPCLKLPPPTHHHPHPLLSTSILIFALHSTPLLAPSISLSYPLSLYHVFAISLFFFPFCLVLPSLVLHFFFYLPYITSLVSYYSSPPSPSLHPQSPPATPQSAYSSRHSFAHSFTHSYIFGASFIPLFIRHSFTGLPTRRGFIGGQLRHLRFQSSPAECLPPHFLTRLFTLLLLFTHSLVRASGLTHLLMYKVAGLAQFTVVEPH